MTFLLYSALSTQHLALLRAQHFEEIAAQNQITPKAIAFRLGAFGDYSMMYHKTLANVFNNDADCGVFSNGTGKGFSAGLLGEIPIFKKLDLYASAGFAQRGGNFGDAINYKDTVFDQNSQTYKGLTVTNSYTSTIPEIIAGIGLKFSPFQKLPFYIRGGIALNFPFSSSATFTQSEHISSPEGVVYQETHTTTKVDNSGKIINLRETFGATGAIGFPVPLSERFTASPEVEYYYPFTELKNDFHWKTQTLQAGIALRYNFYKEAPTPSLYWRH